MTASPSSLARARKAARNIESFQDWIRGKGGSDLIVICRAIGGDVWAKRTQLARHSVLEGHGPYVVRARLQAPLKLLRLSQAGRLPGVKGSCFQQIDPGDPKAATVEVCIERLEDVLTALELVSPAGSAPKRRTAR